MHFYYILITIGVIDCVTGHTCSYEPPKLDEVVTNVNIGVFTSHNGRRKRSITQLRIVPYYDPTFNNQVGVEDKKNIVQEAVNFWQNALQPKPISTSDNIKLDRFCNTRYVAFVNESNRFIYYCANGCKATTTCGPVTVPDAHLNTCREVINNQTVETGTAGPGMSNADFILYIASAASEKCTSSTILGYAAHCQLEATLDRPIAGYINFCPGRLKTTLGEVTQSRFTAKHEILHALGFAVSLFAYFRDSSGVPYTNRSLATGKPTLGFYNSNYSLYMWSDTIIKRINRPWLSKTGTQSKVVNTFIGVNALREARAHYNCPSLDGLDLEDQGGLGVADTHWEKRLVENELMSPTYTQRDKISRMTLGFMEDTGWYNADYSMATNLVWGKNLGCDFVMKSCYEYMQNRKANSQTIWPFCDLPHETSKSFKTACNIDGDAYGYCNLVKYDVPLPSMYQYFNSLSSVSSTSLLNYGSQIALADYCPYIQEFSWKDGDVVSYTTECDESLNNRAPSKNYLAEYYGSTSTCFNQDTDWTFSRCGQSYSPDVKGAACYKYMCSSQYGLLLVVNGINYQCTSSDQAIYSSSSALQFKGTIRCPNCTDKCSSAVCNAPQTLLKAEPLKVNMPCKAANFPGPQVSAFVYTLVIAGLFGLVLLL